MLDIVTNQYDEYATIRINQIILEIYHILLTKCICNDFKLISKTFVDNGYAKYLMKYISEHYTEDLSLEQLGRIIGLSPQYLSKYFKRTTNMGVLQYINMIRLHKERQSNVNPFFISYSIFFPHKLFISKQFKGGESEMKKGLFSILKSLIVAYVVTGLLLLFIALLMQKFGLSDNQVRLFVIMIYGVSTILGGLVFGKIKKNKRLINGLLFGIMYFAVLVLVSALINHGFENEAGKNIISFVICILGGIIGGIMS